MDMSYNELLSVKGVSAYIRDDATILNIYS